jgi:hypothetical protein
MSEQDLRELMDRLRQEVANLPDDDVDARSRLDGIIADLDARLDGDESTAATGLRGSIQDSIHQLEARHPDATTVLNNIMMTLANMGI